MVTLSTHAQRLENWLGKESVEQISRNMQDWYGPPIAIMGVPGRVYARRGGDFVGTIRGGGLASFACFAEQRIKRILRNAARRSESKLNTGFASLSDLIAEATTGGKRQDWMYFKNGSLAVSGGWASLWNVGAFPAAGGTPAARPGGAVPTNATAGAIPFADPGGSDTLHLLTAQSLGTTAPNTLLLYDRIFHAATINHNTTSGQTVTGVPTRYATTTSPGNFAFLEITTVLGATAHNLTMCVDPKTECLSRRLGWTRFDRLLATDEILVFDPGTALTRWERPKQIFVNANYSGPMMHVGGPELGAFTTPNHRWPVELRERRVFNRRRFQVRLSESLGREGFLLRGAKHSAPTVATLPDELVRLVGWYVTEGSLHVSGQGITICQSQKANREHVEAIRDDLVALGARNARGEPYAYDHNRKARVRREGLWYSEVLTDEQIVRWLITGAGVDAILLSAPGKEKIPTMDFLCSLTDEQLAMFIDVVEMGDGTPEKGIIYQHHVQRMDALCAAAVLAGWAPSIHSEGTAMSLRRLQGRGRGRTYIGKLHRDTVDYAGTVWCPVTDAGHWVARRNGKVFITGNTYTDQAGNSAEAAAALAIIVSSAVTRIPHTPWFIPLNSGDTGCRTVTNIAFSAASTGVSNIVQGHPLAFIPQPIANSMVVMDGINSAFNFVQLLTGCCMSMLELKGVGSATSYNGHLIACSG